MITDPTSFSPLIVPEPRIGIFWFVPSDEGSALIEFSLPASEVQMVGGMRTYPVGHVQAWRCIRIAQVWLQDYEHEFFPRGRVNQVNGGDEYILLADPSIFRAGLAEQVIEHFNLGGATVHHLYDSHYRTNRLPTLYR